MRETRIVLVVTGGIAAYKSAFLVRLLRQGGAEVRIVMTEAATRFVAPLTFEVLSEHPVHRDLFASRDPAGVEHVELARWAQRIVVAPATADFLAKAATGLADDLASTVLLAARCPVFFAPAMNDAMWRNPALERNIDTLRRDGRRFIEPQAGDLACGETGAGRMAEPERIVSALEGSFAPPALEGLRVLVTAGRTEEDIDPVRFISNRSSGRMGFALAAAARERGADVTVIHGAVDLPPPAVDAVMRIGTAAEMAAAVKKAFPRCDLLLMAAAVADYRPLRRERAKIRRGGALTVELSPTADILAAVCARKRERQVVVGFALETQVGEKAAREKAERKGCDYLVLNHVGAGTGFGSATNQVTLFRGTRRLFETPVVAKEEAAALLIERIAADRRLRRAPGAGSS